MCQINQATASAADGRSAEQQEQHGQSDEHQLVDLTANNNNNGNSQQLETDIYAMHIKRCDLFAFIRNTMLVAGMFPLQLKHYLPNYLHQLAVALELLFELFLYIVTIHIAILYMCTLFLYKNDGNLELLVNCMIQTIIYIWTITMKLYFRRMQPFKLQNLMSSINREYRLRSADGFTYVTMHEALAMSNRWIKVYVYCCYIGTIFWLLLPIAYGDHSLPLACWYPFDYTQPILYETMYFLQFVGQIQVAAAFSASSGFHMVLSILLSGQFDVLYCSLKNIVATAYLRMGANRNELSGLRKKQIIADAEPNEYYCAKEHRTSMEGLIQQQHHYVMQMPEYNTFSLAFKNSFKACIQHHRYIIEALQQMESFYSPIWFFKTGEVILLMCLVAFVSVKSTTANSFMKMLSLGQYLLLVAWELLIICYFGEVIYLNSQRCGEALLRSPWYLHMREMKYDFLLFLLNSKRSFKLTAGKIYSLNVDRFRGIMTTAFSFLTLLQKMDARNQ